MHLRRARGWPGIRPSPWLVWGLAAGFYVLAMFHRMSLGVASLEASERTGVPVEAIGLVSAAQLGLYLALIIPAGLAADRLGPRITLAGGLAAMAAGEILFGVAQGPALALAGRAAVGVGDAFIFLSVLRVAQSWFPARRYATLALLTAGAGALGQIATTVPLGAGIETLGYVPVFVGSGVVTAAAAVLCLVAVRDRPPGAAPRRTPRPAARGALRVAIARAWARPGTRRAFWTHFSLMGPFVAVTALWGYPFMVRGRGFDPSDARVVLLACVALCALASPAFGALLARAPGARDRVTAGTAVPVAALWGAALLWPGGAPAALVALAVIATGPACAAAMLAFDIARADSPPARGGIATGLANTGGFTAAVIAQLAVAGLLRAGGADPGWSAAMLPIPALMVVGIAQMALHGRRAAATAPRRVAAAAPPARARED